MKKKFTDSSIIALVAAVIMIVSLFLPYAALKLYYLTGKEPEYLQAVYTALEDYDAFLWKYRRELCVQSDFPPYRMLCFHKLLPRRLSATA